MRFLVIGSCTGEKDDAHCPSNLKLREADFERPSVLQSREAELTEWMKPATVMYTGRQHSQMMAGISLLRSSFGQSCCDVAILSAGYGLLKENRSIAPYDVTFQHKPKQWIRQRGEVLGIPTALRGLIPQYRLVFILLGNDYLLSAKPPLPIEPTQKFIYFGSGKKRIVPNRDIVIVPTAREEATRFHDGIMTLKGRMFSLFAIGLSRQPEIWTTCWQTAPQRRCYNSSNLARGTHVPQRRSEKIL
jgi:hypothetical protein